MRSARFFAKLCWKPILSEITVGAGVPDCPQIRLLKHGEISDRYIRQLNDFYQHISVDKYVIMPDHIHILITVRDGQSRTPVPTRDNKVDNANSVIASFVGTFKRFCNKEYGENIWQSRYYDHVIRNEQDYRDTWEYIENNPLSWKIKKGKV